MSTRDITSLMELNMKDQRIIPRIIWIKKSENKMQGHMYVPKQYKGIKDTDRKGRVCFCEFLNSEIEFEVLKDERKNTEGHYLKEALPSKFYKNIRCGILHQGETNEGFPIAFRH